MGAACKTVILTSYKYTPIYTFHHTPDAHTRIHIHTHTHTLVRKKPSIAYTHLFYDLLNFLNFSQLLSISLNYAKPKPGSHQFGSFHSASTQPASTHSALNQAALKETFAMVLRDEPSFPPQTSCV